MPTKSDLSFDDLLRAGLRVPLKPAQPPRPKTRQTKRRARKTRQKTN